MRRCDLVDARPPKSPNGFGRSVCRNVSHHANRALRSRSEDTIISTRVLSLQSTPKWGYTDGHSPGTAEIREDAQQAASHKPETT